MKKEPHGDLRFLFRKKVLKMGGCQVAWIPGNIMKKSQIAAVGVNHLFDGLIIESKNEEKMRGGLKFFES